MAPPPQQSASTPPTSARQVRARAPNPTNTPSSSSEPCKLLTLPLELLDEIRAQIEDESDGAGLAATCKALWARWGRPDDWPVSDRWGRGKAWSWVHAEEEVPLFRNADARPGQKGVQPFCVDSAIVDRGRIVLRCLEVAATDLCYMDGQVRLTQSAWLRKSRSEPSVVGFKMDWLNTRQGMVKVTAGWLRKNFPCWTCNGVGKVWTDVPQLVGRWPALEKYSSRQRKRIACPNCAMNYRRTSIYYSSDEDTGNQLLDYLRSKYDYESEDDEDSDPLDHSV